MPSTIENTIAEYFAAIRSMDADRCAALFAPDAIQHDPVGAPANDGVEAIRAFFAGIFSGSQMVRLDEQAVYTGGNSGAAKWTAKAVSHSGKPVSFEGIDVIDCDDDGKIVQVRAFWDPGPVMSVLQS